MAEDRMLSDEILLGLINKNKGGGGGTSNYNDLSNQPQINGNTLTGNKSASDLGLVAAETGKGLSTNDYTNEDKAIVGGVTAALAGKQDALTAGDYIDITNNKISVNRNIIPDNTTYNIKHVSQYNAVVTKYINGVKQSENNYQYWGGTVWTIDDAFKLVCDRDTGSGGFAYQLLADTIDHTAGYYGFLFDLYETSVGVEVDLVFPDEDTSGRKLIIKSEMDTALADKQDKTDNSLQTTDKTVVGAINEHEGDISSLMSGLTNVNIALALPENTGKNVLPTSLENIKSLNSSGSWDGNTVTINGVSFQVVTSDDKVTGIVVNRVSSNENVAIFTVGQYTAKSGDVLSGCPSGGSNQTYKLYSRGGSTNDTGNGATIVAGDVGVSRSYSIAVFATGSPVNLEFYPMIRPATITDATFAPYIPSVESRIEAVESGNYKVIASVTADGVKSYSDLFSEFFASLTGGIERRYKLIFSQGAYAINQKGTNHSSFGRVLNFDGAITISAIDIKSNNTAKWTSIAFASDGTATVTDNSANVPPVGAEIKLVV